jgi:hypothetical protein
VLCYYVAGDGSSSVLAGVCGAGTQPGVLPRGESAQQESGLETRE